MFAAGSAVVVAGDGVAANLTVLVAGFAANTGLDMAGGMFGLAYQDAAESLLKAATAAINACGHSGALIQVGASNYSRAEAASTLGGGAGVLHPPAEPATIAAPGPPGTLGPGQPPPLLWALVESLVDDVWPDGDVAAVHAAAARWRSFGAALGGTQGALSASKSLLDGLQIPEGGKIDEVLSQMGCQIAGIGEQCGRLAATLHDFASEVDQAQNAIRDLLHRLGSLANLAHDVVLIFDGDALDEIEKIAQDINAVLHNLGREARAVERGAKLVMQLGDGPVVNFEKYMRRQFTHFLGEDVGNPVATAFDTWVNANEGVIKGAAGMLEGMVDLDPRWFFFDPKGAAATWSDLAKSVWKGSLINASLNPQEAGEANLQRLKSLLHLNDWSTARPGLGLGENLFDGATLFLPGVGEVGAGAKGAAAGARAAEEGGEAAGAAGRVGERTASGIGEVAGARGALSDIADAGGKLTEELEGLNGTLSRFDPLLGGRPVDLAAPEPMEAPVESTRAPDTAHSPSTPPELLPAGGPHEPGSAPSAGSPIGSVPGAAGQRVPATAPQLVEHSPARVPPSPSGSPFQSAPVAVHTPQPAPATASPAPHVSVPTSTPSPGRPAAIPGSEPRGDAPHGRSHGGSLRAYPHEGQLNGGGADGPGGSAPGDGHGTGVPRDGEDHDAGDDCVSRGHDALADELSAEKRDEIIAIPKGARPDPSEYLSQQYIESHLAKFANGATRFMPKTNLEKYGIAQRDGTSFVMPKSEADEMIEASNGDSRAMERRLGPPDGFLDSHEIVRIDIAHPEPSNLRIPSGNEAGANEQWIPGGWLPDGASEAVVDGGEIPSYDYTVTDVLE